MSDPRPDFDPENTLEDPERGLPLPQWTPFDDDAPKTLVISERIQRLIRQLHRAAKIVMATAEPCEFPHDTYVRTSAIKGLSAALAAIDLAIADVRAANAQRR